jgi:predicted dithiol-disulfide oxidoreductase (DUF899 family)
MAEPLKDARALAEATPIRFPNESAGYRAARTALLAEEIELRRHIARVAAMRQALPPGGEVIGDYRFIGANGPTDFAGLFGPHDTLVTYSLMYGPDRERPCPMCTNLLGPLAANAADIGRQAALAVIARSPYERIAAYARERGWQPMPLYQDVNDAFSRDYFGLLPDGSEVPALNVFTRRDGIIRHHWGGEFTSDSADPGQDPRGAPDLAPLWNILDLTPCGRPATWYPSLSYD